MPNLKQFVSIFFLLVIASQSLVKLAIVIDWKLHQTEITEALCENKDKPEMECNGKCHLEKQLEKVEEPTKEADKKSAPSTLKNIETELFYPMTQIFYSPVNEYIGVINPTIYHYTFNYKPSFYFSCFHPPENNA